MVYELNEISENVKKLFEGWEETLIYSCLQKVMGKVFVTDMENPSSACAVIGVFTFFAGIPIQELLDKRHQSFAILVPQNNDWEKLIEENIHNAKKVARYAIRKDTKFDKKNLQELVNILPEGYEIHRIDEKLYDQCLLNPATIDFVSAFETKDNYLKKGRGMVVLKDGEIVAGASSYTSYIDGIEIEVDTIPAERRKHLATAVCAALILDCLEAGIYPSWDAQNMDSVRLSAKLGYEFSHEYVAYEVVAEK